MKNVTPTPISPHRHCLLVVSTNISWNNLEEEIVILSILRRIKLLLKMDILIAFLWTYDVNH